MESYVYVVYQSPDYCDDDCCEVVEKIFLRKYKAEKYIEKTRDEIQGSLRWVRWNLG